MNKKIKFILLPRLTSVGYHTIEVAFRGIHFWNKSKKTNKRLNKKMKGYCSVKEGDFTPSKHESDDKKGEEFADKVENEFSLLRDKLLNLAQQNVSLWRFMLFMRRGKKRLDSLFQNDFLDFPSSGFEFHRFNDGEKLEELSLYFVPFEGARLYQCAGLCLYFE